MSTPPRRNNADSFEPPDRWSIPVASPIRLSAQRMVLRRYTAGKMDRAQAREALAMLGLDERIKA